MISETRKLQAKLENLQTQSRLEETRFSQLKAEGMANGDHVLELQREEVLALRQQINTVKQQIAEHEQKAAEQEAAAANRSQSTSGLEQKRKELEEAKEMLRRHPKDNGCLARVSRLRREIAKLEQGVSE